MMYARTYHWYNTQIFFLPLTVVVAQLNKLLLPVAGNTPYILTLLHSARNPEVSDTTGDAICTTASNQKTYLLYLARMIRYWPLLLLLSLNASSQDATTFKPDSVRRTIAAVQVEPFQGAAASFETVVKVLFNRQFLYVGIFSQDTAGRKTIRATDFKCDFNQLAHDLVSLSFDGFNDQRNAMNYSS